MDCPAPSSLVADLENAQQGEDGESYIDEDDFIVAIAPEGEDYVSDSFWVQLMLVLTLGAAQDTARAVRSPLPSSGSKQARKDHHVRIGIFDNLLTKSDASPWLASRLFGLEGKGVLRQGSAVRPSCVCPEYRPGSTPPSLVLVRSTLLASYEGRR